MGIKKIIPCTLSLSLSLSLGDASSISGYTAVIDNLVRKHKIGEGAEEIGRAAIWGANRKLFGSRDRMTQKLVSL
jgi:hypothetical protein